MRIKIKRIYDGIGPDDGVRILVDRLWPRGLKKETARVDLWVKDLAPSNELRKWYGHDPKKWEVFKKKYFAELDNHPEEIKELRKTIRKNPATFLYSSKETELNNAHALARYLKEKS